MSSRGRSRRRSCPRRPRRRRSTNSSPRSCRCDDREGAWRCRSGRRRAPRSAASDLAVPRLVALENVVELAGAARFREELRAEADQAARRHARTPCGPSRSRGSPCSPCAPCGARAAASRRRGTPPARRSTTRSIGSWSLPSIVARDHLGLADRQLEALATHHLDEHRQLELAATLHLPAVGPVGGHDADRRRCPRPPGPAGPSRARAVTFVPSFPASGDVLMPNVIDSEGSSTRVTRERPRVVGVGEAVADGHLVEPRDGDDLARAGLVDGDAVERLARRTARRSSRGSIVPSARHQRDRLAAADRAVADAARARAGRRTARRRGSSTSAWSG